MLTPEQIKRKQERKAKAQSARDKALNQRQKLKRQKEANRKEVMQPVVNWQMPKPKEVGKEDVVFKYLESKILPDFELVEANLTYPSAPKAPRVLLVMTLKDKQTGKYREFSYNYKKIHRAIKDGSIHQWEEENASNANV